MQGYYERGLSCAVTISCGANQIVDGVVTQAKAENPDGKKKTPIKVLRKIPPEVIREAKGLAIFTSMRSGFAPFGGAGGAGIVVAKLPDGSESVTSHPIRKMGEQNADGG